MLEPEKQGRLKSVLLAVIVCVCLGALVALAPMYPCGYWDTDGLYAEGGFAGYGYHSLSEVLGRGFFWEADSAPVPYTEFEGSAPFYAVGQWYISLLYIPIYLAIAYFGFLVVELLERRMKRAIL